MEYLVPLLSKLLPTGGGNDLSYQILSAFVSLLALYAALMSIYNTTRYTLRLIWFFTKYGTASIALLSIYNYASPNPIAPGLISTVHGFASKQSVSRAYRMGKRGVEYWATTANSLSSFNKKSNSRRSASGLRRTWATASEGGGYDGLDNDSAGDQNGVEDILNFLKENVVTFMSSSDRESSTGKASSKKGKKVTKKAATSKKGKRGAKKDDGMGTLVSNFAWNRLKVLVSGFM